MHDQNINNPIKQFDCLRVTLTFGINVYIDNPLNSYAYIISVPKAINTINIIQGPSPMGRGGGGY